VYVKTVLLEREYNKDPHAPMGVADELTFRLTVSQDSLISLQAMVNDFPITWQDVLPGHAWWSYWQVAILAHDLPQPEPYIS
jgi:hypothetical protein